MKAPGFTLVELLIAMAASALLISGAVQLALAAGRSYHLQQNLGAIQENARFALDSIAREVRQAGYEPRPWIETAGLAAIHPDSANVGIAPGDRIALQRHTDRNCHDNANPVTDPDGHPLHYLMVTSFRISGSGNLAMTCSYGPDTGNLVTQINGLGLVQNAEALQVLYAEDSDGDFLADRWVEAGGWQHERTVQAVRIALLLASPDRVVDGQQQHFSLLGESFDSPPDGRLRRVSTATIAIRGRLP